MSGCWEQYCSGNALVRLARARGCCSSRRCSTEMCGGRPERLTGPMVTAAAEAGDLVARQSFAAIGEWLGIGLGALTSALDPEVVVVGGGVSAAGDRLLDPARAALERSHRRARRTAPRRGWSRPASGPRPGSSAPRCSRGWPAGRGRRAPP